MTNDPTLTPPVQNGRVGVQALASRITALQRTRGGRVIVGIAGQPGSGKSTLAALIAAAIGDSAAVVPMDGFHLRNTDLIRLERRDRKGAPDTFDVEGFVQLLLKLRNEPQNATKFPEFNRDLDEPVHDACEVRPETTMVIVDGNYLLTQDHGWNAVKPLFDEVWYVDLEPTERMNRLVRRHRHFGMTLDRAVSWAGGPDQANAQLIESTRNTADLIVVGE